MKKKFVVAVAAVVMAAVMSVSAFAADGVTVSSITGDATGPASEIFVPQSSAEASATANAAYNTLASTEGGVADKLTALAGGKAVVKQGTGFRLHAVPLRCLPAAYTVFYNFKKIHCTSISAQKTAACPIWGKPPSASLLMLFSFLSRS